MTGFQRTPTGVFLAHLPFGLHVRQRRRQRRRPGCFQLKRAKPPLILFFAPSLNAPTPDRSTARSTTRLCSVNRHTKPLPNQHIANVILQPRMSTRARIPHTAVDSTCSRLVSDSKKACHCRRRSAVRDHSERPRSEQQLQVHAARPRYCAHLPLGSFPKNM